MTQKKKTTPGRESDAQKEGHKSSSRDTRGAGTCNDLQDKSDKTKKTKTTNLNIQQPDYSCSQLFKCSIQMVIHMNTQCCYQITI